MQTAEKSTSVLVNTVVPTKRTQIKLGERVMLVSGALRGLTGLVARRDEPDTYLIGVPDLNSGILIRVHRQRVRHLPSRRCG